MLKRICLKIIIPAVLLTSLVSCGGYQEEPKGDPLPPWYHVFEYDRNIYVGGEPAEITFADLNQDGIEDVVTSDFSRGRMVKRSGLFNDDLYPDLVVADYDRMQIWIYLNNGDGTFSSSYINTSKNPHSVAVWDFNRDNLDDLIYAYSDMIVFLPGNGDGTFGAAVPSSTAGAPNLNVTLTLADMDRDNLMDVVVGRDGTRAGVAVMLGYGDGTFARKGGAHTGIGPVDVAIADFNRDNFPDLFVVNPGSDNVVVLKGYGDGTIEYYNEYDIGDPSPGAEGETPVAIAAADFDHDTYLDFAVVSENLYYIDVYFGERGGVFNDGTYNYSLSDGGYCQQPSDVVAHDKDNDGDLDLYVSCLIEGKVVVMENTTIRVE